MAAAALSSCGGNHVCQDTAHACTRSGALSEVSQLFQTTLPKAVSTYQACRPTEGVGSHLQLFEGKIFLTASKHDWTQPPFPLGAMKLFLMDGEQLMMAPGVWVVRLGVGI